MSTYALTEDDRKFLVDRLDRDHLNGIATQVRTALDAGMPVEAVYQPGDATNYALMFVPAEHLLANAPGGGTGDHAGHRFFNDCTLVVYLNRDTLAPVPQHSDAEWVASKLTENTASVIAIAELLRAIGLAA